MPIHNSLVITIPASSPKSGCIDVFNCFFFIKNICLSSSMQLLSIFYLSVVKIINYWIPKVNKNVETLLVENNRFVHKTVFNISSDLQFELQS